MSVLPQLADIHCGSRNVRHVPLVADRSGYQSRGIWDSFDVVWGRHHHKTSASPVSAPGSEGCRTADQFL
jgi:hypothetical protein